MSATDHLIKKRFKISFAVLELEKASGLETLLITASLHGVFFQPYAYWSVFGSTRLGKVNLKGKNG